MRATLFIAVLPNSPLPECVSQVVTEAVLKQMSPITALGSLKSFYSQELYSGTQLPVFFKNFYGEEDSSLTVGNFTEARMISCGLLGFCLRQHTFVAIASRRTFG